MKLSYIASACGLETVGDFADIDIKGVTSDSRNVKQGDIFICINGTVSDGHKYIPDAAKAGASAFVICDKEAFYEYRTALPRKAIFLYAPDCRKTLARVSSYFYGDPAKKLRIIGITGTKGKTSTSFMIRDILKGSGINVGLIGTTGAYYNDKKIELDNSTPESLELNKIFAEMVKAGVTHVVMEVSSQGIMMDRVYGIEFETAVFTNLSPDHIGENEHKDFEEYKSTKGELFRRCKNAVISADSEHSDFFADIARESGANVVTYSATGNTADLYAANPKFIIDEGLETTYDLCGSIPVKVSTPGQFTVSNSLAAIAACETVGIDKAACVGALAHVSVIGRTEPVKHPKCDFAVLIDYAHNALSLESLFNAVRAYSPKRIICLFGCGGNRSKLRRYEMGEISGKYADISIITSDNPRFEEPDDIIADILIGMNKTNGEYVVISDRVKAIHYALSIAKKGDIVLLVGKGNEMYQEIKGKKYHMDEREIVKDYFDSLN